MSFLISCTIRVSLILAAGLLIRSCLRSRSAALRHFVLTVSILSAAAVPVLMLLMPVSPVEIWTQPALSWVEELKPAPFVRTANDTDTAAVLPQDAAATAPPASRPALPEPERRDVSTDPLETVEQPARTPDKNPPSRQAMTFPGLNAVSILIGIWLIGVFITSASLVGGILHLRRLVSPRLRLTADSHWGRLTSEIATQYRLRRNVGLFECHRASILATWGVLRPKLLLPAGARDWPEDRIRVVLHHELAHIQRGDWWILLAAEIQRAVYWFNPLCWIMCRNLVRDSEQACDDTALRGGIVASEYAEHLLSLARVLKTPVRAAALSISRASTLERRFSAILNPQTDRNAVRGAVMLATLAVFAGLALPLTSFRATASTFRAPEIMEVPQPPLAPAEILQQSSPTALGVAAASTVSQRGAQPGQGTSIRGTVMRFGSSEPVPGASVELRKVQCGEGGTPPEIYTALTNLPNPYWTQGAGPLTAPQVLKTTTADDGRFAYENLAPGSYCIVAFRGGGYLAAEYLQRSHRGPGSTITLAEGQQLSNVNLSLVPTGSISGRVTDAKGEPVAHAIVLPLEPVMYEGRRRLNVAMSTVQTMTSGSTVCIGSRLAAITWPQLWKTPGGARFVAAPFPLVDSGERNC